MVFILKDFSKVELLREKTYIDLMEKLYRHGRCALVRPTGFGKTGILTKLLKNYDKVLFLYPSDVVRDAVLRFYYGDGVSSDATIPNVNFMSYMCLIGLSEEEMSDLDVDLIIADECHRLGAKETSKAMRKLLDLKDVHFVGATATPVRMDLFDVISEFFYNNVVFEYTLHDAIQDGIYKKPCYCYCTYADASVLKEVEDDTMEEIAKIDVDKERAVTNLRSSLEGGQMNVFSGSYSSIYMSRNRKRGWDEPSFTIQASGRQAPLHPSGAPMKKVGIDKWVFDDTISRRLSIQEVARVQTFPDWYEFTRGNHKSKDGNLDIVYRQIGNAVPVRLAMMVAEPIARYVAGGTANESGGVSREDLF